MSIAGLILGVLNIAIVVVVLLLLGAAGQLILTKLGWGPSGEIRNLYIGLVALIALYMLVALLLGFPTIRFL